MIQLSAHTRILLAVAPVDFRKGIDGVAALCQSVLKENPRDGQYFVFINRDRTMVRLLHYDGNGYWLATKRLSKGRFPSWPEGIDAQGESLMAMQLRPLLAGLSWKKD